MKSSRIALALMLAACGGSQPPPRIFDAAADFAHDAAVAQDAASDAAHAVDAASGDASHPTGDMAGGPIAWWKGDGNANDSAGSYNGTVQGAVTYTTGHTGQAFSFPGTAAEISVPDGIVPGSAQSFTVAAWVWVAPLGLGSPLTIFYAGSKGGEFQLFLEQNTGQIGFLISGSDNGQYGAYSQFAALTGTWLHITGVRRGSVVELWQGGTMSSSISIPVGALVDASGTSSSIGAANQSYSEWQGYIDDLRIYDRALSSTEIGDL
jgi:hypothetical protein